MISMYSPKLTSWKHNIEIPKCIEFWSRAFAGEGNWNDELTRVGKSHYLMALLERFELSHLPSRVTGPSATVQWSRRSLPDSEQISTLCSWTFQPQKHEPNRFLLYCSTSGILFQRQKTDQDSLRLLGSVRTIAVHVLISTSPGHKADDFLN